MIPVRFDRANFNKCLCGGCPVQRESACVSEKDERLGQLREDIERYERMPEPPQALAGVYCSIGRSECEDLNGGKPCLCPSCPVFLGHGLGKNYYCLRGTAEEVG